MADSEQGAERSNGTPAVIHKEAALFAHAIWKTRSGAPLLAAEDTAKAAYVAVAARARNYRCRVMAIGGTADHIHVVFRFAASVPLSVLARQSIEASAEAVAQMLYLTHEHKIAPANIWQASYGLCTVSESELDSVIAYVRQQPELHRQQKTCAVLEAVSAHREPRVLPPWSETIREGSRNSYHAPLAD